MTTTPSPPEREAPATPAESAPPLAAVHPGDAAHAEAGWLRWLALPHGWQPLNLDVKRLVVIAAHPDDEVLGAGGVVFSAATQGVEVVTICLTDGRSAHPGSSPEQLADRRHVEMDTAAALLGLHPPRWAGLPSGSLSDFADALVDLIDAAVAEKPTIPTGLLAVWENDGEPDHDAAGAAAASVAARRGLPLWMYPVRMWHWAHPDDPAVPWSRIRVHDVDPTVLAVKHAAARSFATQKRAWLPTDESQPELGRNVTSHLLRRTEYIIS
ncbi:PIG-L deacetylase family protein [Gordonia sp. NPDC003429]